METRGEQLRLYFWRYSAVACHKLVTLIHGYSYLVVGYKKLRSFQGTQANLSVLLEKPDITYRGTLNTESLEPSCRISPRPRIMLKIFYFSGSHQFFQISPGIKSLYDRVENLFICWPERHNLGAGRQFQQIYWPGKPPGRISPGYLDRVLKRTVNFWRKVFRLYYIF